MPGASRGSRPGAIERSQSARDNPTPQPSPRASASRAATAVIACAASRTACANPTASPTSSSAERPGRAPLRREPQRVGGKPEHADQTPVVDELADLHDFTLDSTTDNA